MKTSVFWFAVYVLLVILEFPGFLILLDKAGLTTPRCVTKLLTFGFDIVGVAEHDDSGNISINILNGDPAHQRIMGWKMVPLTNKEILLGVESVNKAIAAYPKGLLLRAGIKGIIIGKQFQPCDHSWLCRDQELGAGRAQVSLGLLSAPFIITEGHKVLFYDEWVHIFHHEVGHFFVKLVSISNWARCNEGKSYNPTGWDTGSYTQGFVTPYARSNLAEDIAETFSIIITGRPSAIDNFSLDTSIACKFELIKRMLVGAQPLPSFK